MTGGCKVNYKKGEFFLTKFMGKQKTNSNDLKISALGNELHVLLDKPLRAAVPNFSVVEQSAKLASHFLESGVLDNLIATLANNGRPGSRFRDTAGAVDLQIALTSSKNERQTAQNLLVQLAGTISFKLDAKMPCDATSRTVSDKKYANGTYSNGVKSMIKISKQKYDLLKLAQQAKDKDIPLILQLQVDFANMLVHEIGHAIEYFTHGGLEEWTYLGDSFVYEAGFEFESHLYGGGLGMLREAGQCTRAPEAWELHTHEDIRSGLSGALMLWEYPYQGLVHDYRPGGGLKTRAEPVDVWPYDIAWRVSITFLQQLFSDTFWQQNLQVIRRALRPWCDIGYCFRLDDEGKPVPVKHCDKDTDEQGMYVPPGFRRLSSGDIIREAQGSTVDTFRF